MDGEASTCPSGILLEEEKTHKRGVPRPQGLEATSSHLRELNVI